MKLLLALIPITLAVVQYLDINKIKYIKTNREHLRSFSAGFSVAYVFLLLFPELPELGIRTNINTALFSLVGFALFHEAHKLVFQQHDKQKKKLLLKDVHLITAGLYSFLVTFFLVEITKQDLFQGIIITAIIAAHMILSEISQVELAKNQTRSRTILVTALTLAGGMLALFNLLNVVATTILFAITAGAIAYIAIREEIPNDDRVRPLFFVKGVLVLIILEILFL